MPSAEEMLKKLQERQDKLNAKIKEAKLAAAKEAATLDDERHRLIGAAVAIGMNESEELRALVEPLLDAHTAGTRARKLLGLKGPGPSQEPQSTTDEEPPVPQAAAS